MSVLVTAFAGKAARCGLEMVGYLGAALLCLAACCGVAIINGMPLLFPDTAAYVISGASLSVPWDRPIYYGRFTRPFLFANLWPIVILQSAVILCALWAVARVVRGEVRAAQFTVLVLALCVFSGLPWVAGQVIPDIFTTVVILGFFALCFDEAELAGLERFVLWVLTSLAIATHLSHIPLAAGIIIVCLICRLWLFGRIALLRTALVSGVRRNCHAACV